LQRLQDNKFLIILFILAVSLFTWLRWNPTPWFNAQLADHGLAAYVHIKSAEKSGLGLHLNDVRIQTPKGITVHVDALTLSPAWFRMIRGTLALHVQGEIRQATFALNISLQDHAIWLHDMDLFAPVGMLKDYIAQTAMLNLTGTMQASGDIKLDQQNGIPLEGALVLQWDKAASALLGKQPLGDFKLQLTSSKNSAWVWKIHGGKALSINGKGHLSTASQQPKLWRVDGAVQSQSQGAVASMLSSMSGQSQWNLTVSGVISHPNIQYLKP